MSLLLYVCAIAFIGIAVWGFQSVMAEVPKSYSAERGSPIALRFEVDEFVWSARAPMHLRRRYVATQVCLAPAGLCLAAVVWLNEPQANVRIWVAIAFCSVSGLIAIYLTWKAIRPKM
jgi:hypothetical protein